MSPEPRLDADTHAENEKLRELLQAREAELSVLNSIQEALMAGEDIDSIFEIAGEQISKIFPGEGVALYTYDPETHIGEAKYILEDGERHYPPPFKAGAIGRKAASTKQTLVLNTRQEFKDIGAVTVEGTKPSLSGIYAPMLVNERPVGAFNVESTQREHAFDDADVQLVNSIARSLSIALENARLFNKTQQLLEETEARNAELAIINIVQSALASKLDIQAIYDIVGDKLQEVFSDAQVVDILTYDPATQLFHPRFVIERGKRYEVEPWIARGFRKHVINTGEPLVINSDMEAMAKEYDNNWVVLGEFAKSFVGVPMMIGSVPSGVISLQHLDKEYAFSESDVRLIQTLAGSMSVALENARLFKETEERNAELAIINTVQQALASELDIQGIYDAVGEKLRTIFDSQIVAIYSTDIEARIQTCVYAFEKGRRLEVVSQSIGSLHDYLLEVDDTMVFNSNFEEFAAQFEDYQVSQGEMPRSVAIVPVPRMKDPNTYVSLTLQDVDGEKEFTDSDVRLLETLASSMGVALENARLFNETQRLLKETEQRAAELTTINMVGKALVAEPDLDALFELIGEQMRIIFDADIVYVAMLDPDTKIIHFPYTYGEDFEPLELGQGLTSKVIDSGKPLLINTDMDKRRQELGVTRVGKQAASYLGVPIRMGDRAVGVISVQNTSDEEAFCEDDMRLLNTIAANVSAAIRNAQLFAEITHQKQYYEAVIENSPAAIILLDLEANVTGWNPAAERLFGYSEAEALGRNIDDLVASREDLYQEAVRYSHQALREKQVRLLARRTRKDGSLVEVDVSGLPVRVDGEYVGFIAIYHDVTELQRARLAAEEANRAKSTFLANMSHELRTPLNAIIGFTRIVRRKSSDLLPEKQIDNLDKVLVSAEHLLSLINTVLDISKIEAGRLEVKAEDFELDPIIKQVIDTTQPLIKEGVELSKEIKDELPLMHTDQDKLMQILLNLLSNAAKFTHAGEIKLTAWREGECLLVDVCDTGIGIPEGALDRVFEEFQQADTSTTRQYGGTGLGLSISRSLARLLGGELTASSVEGQGSTFTLSIPIKYEESLSQKQHNQSEPLSLDLSPEKPVILSIDDDPNVHDMLEENLGEHGYQVVRASNGAEGLRLAMEIKPLAITLDIMMPQKDGWQVLHELKSNPQTRDIPVILITIVDKQSLGYRLGAEEYLVKPLEEGAVVSALGRIHRQAVGDQKTRVLVVDDDPNISELITQLLASEEYIVEAASDGQAALDQIEQKAPDVLLLDLMMPQMDGFSLVQTLEQRGLELPIIVLTAKDLSRSELEVLEGSVEKIIMKDGLGREQLLTELERNIDRLRDVRFTKSATMGDTG